MNALNLNLQNKNTLICWYHKIDLISNVNFERHGVAYNLKWKWPYLTHIEEFCDGIETECQPY